MKPIVLKGHEKPINVVKFNFDGDLLFSGSSDKRVNLWYSLTGERVGSYLCRGAIKSLDVTTDSEYLITGSLEGTLEVFKVDGGASAGALAFGNYKVKHLELSYGDSNLLVVLEAFSGNTDNECRIFDFKKLLTSMQNNAVNEAGALLSKFVFKGKKITQLSWNFLNKNLIGSTIDGDLSLYDLKGNVIKGVEDAHDGLITSFSFSQDYSLLITASKDKTSKIWDPETLTLLKVFKQDFPMNTASISPLIDDRLKPRYHVLMGGGIAAREAAMAKTGGFEIHLCHLIYEEEIGSYSGHFGPVNSIVFHRDGRGFVSGGEEGYIRIFRFDKGYFNEPMYDQRIQRL